MFKRPPGSDEEYAKRLAQDRMVIDVIPMKPRKPPFEFNPGPLFKLGMVWTVIVAFFFLLMCKFDIKDFFSLGVWEAIALIGGTPWAILTMIGWALR